MLVFNGESGNIRNDRESQAPWCSKIDGTKIIAIERRGDIKAAVCHHLGHLAQSIGIGNAPCDVVYNARTGIARSVVRRAKEIDDDRLFDGPVPEPEDGPFLSYCAEAERFDQKAGGMLESLDLNFYGANPPYRAALRIGIVRSSAALCVIYVLDQRQFQTIGVSEAQILFSERPSTTHDLDFLLHEMFAPMRQRTRRYCEGDGAYLACPSPATGGTFVDEESEESSRGASKVPEIVVQDGRLVEVDRLPYELQTERVRIELERPMRIGADGSDMMDSSYFGHVCFRVFRLSV
jgi:hypothetical protein